MKIMNRQALCFLIITLLCDPLGSRIYKDFTSPVERSLRERRRSPFVEVEFIPSKDVSKHRKISKNRFSPVQTTRRDNKKQRALIFEENLVKLALSIQKKAHDKKLKIKQVYLGGKVRKTLKDKRLATHLSSLLSSDSLSRRLKTLKRKIRSEARKSKLSRRRKAHPNRDLAGMPSSTGAKGGAKGGQDLSKFNFLPGYAGMPFPPFMMNGPHFHPPLNVTVNAIPNRDSKMELNPSEIEEENLKNQSRSLEPLEEKMKAIVEKMINIEGDVNVELDKHYHKVINLPG